MSAPQPSVIGIIGGSGIYDIPGLENVTWERVHSPFGAPSDQVGIDKPAVSRVLSAHRVMILTKPQ